MKYPAYVVENDSTLSGCPYPGCIKVVCPDIFGYKEYPEFFDAQGKMIIEGLAVSGWVRPHYANPMDFYVPALGQGVYIEGLRGRFDDLIWTGIFPGNDFINLVTDEQNEGINTQQLEDTDRIIGCRNGSFIKIEDKDDGKILIEVFGKNINNTDRIGCQIELDGTMDAEKISILGKTKDESSLQSFIIDMAKDAEKILIIDKEEQSIEFNPVDKKVTFTVGDVVVVYDAQNKSFDMTDGTNIFKTDGNGGTMSFKNSQSGMQAELEKIYDLINDLITAINTISTSGPPPKHTVDPGWDAGVKITQALNKTEIQSIFKD